MEKQNADILILTFHSRPFILVFIILKLLIDVPYLHSFIAIHELQFRIPSQFCFILSICLLYHFKLSLLISLFTCIIFNPVQLIRNKTQDIKLLEKL